MFVKLMLILLLAGDFIFQLHCELLLYKSLPLDEENSLISFDASNSLLQAFSQFKMLFNCLEHFLQVRRLYFKNFYIWSLAFQKKNNSNTLYTNFLKKFKNDSTVFKMVTLYFHG